MSSTPTSTNEESSTARPDIELNAADDSTPSVTDATTPPSELPSATSDFSNVDSSDVKIEMNDVDNETPAAPSADSVLPEAVGSSPLFADSKSAAQPSPATGLRSSPSDNFLSAVLGPNTPTNPSGAFLNFGSATSNRIEYNFNFSSFDFESLNGMFGTPAGAASVDGASGAAGGTNGAAFPVNVQQRQVPQPQPSMDAFPLPSYLQAQLDETYTQASTLIFPNDSSDGNVFYQVTAYRPFGGNMVQSTVNYVPSADAAAQEDKENRVKPPPLPYALPTRKNAPTRKRTIDVHETRPGTGKKMLIRHNLKEDGEPSSCSCKNSRCLKLYCECFRSGKVCNANECGCTGCKNTLANSGPNGVRTKTITDILRRRPDAFEKRERTQEGCRCKKNQCLKKYCVCFNVGVQCDGDKCRCNNCKNYPGATKDDEEEEAKPLSFVEVPAHASSLLAAADAESMSNSSSEELLDKRKRHSKRTRRNKPKYLESPSFFLGSPTVSRTEVV